MTYKKFIFFLLYAALPFVLRAQLKLEITFDKEKYYPGDTIRFKCRVPAWEGTERISTLNVWIENTDHTSIWKLRYPLLKGRSEGDLILPSKFPEDHFAFYFELQNEFFMLKGEILQFYKSKNIDYTFLLENKDLVTGRVEVNKEGRFNLPRHVFPGQATLFFSEVKKSNNINEEINIKINTPLDSGYISIADTLIMRSIGAVSADKADDLMRLQNDLLNGAKGGTLQNVTVYAKEKNRVQQFDEAFATGMFRNDDAYYIDGLDNQFDAFTNILDYLPGRIPGFRAIKNPRGGEYEISWRGETPTFYLDEIPVSPDILSMVPVNDIALIKVFRTPLVRSFVGGSGGTIGVYTKRGGDIGGKTYKNKFTVNGYTPLVFTLTN